MVALRSKGVQVQASRLLTRGGSFHGVPRSHLP